MDASLTAKQRRDIDGVVDRFRSLTAADKRRYQEMEVRTNFIDPLFAALGWRMDDRAEVERETTVDRGKRPDYIFKIGGVPRLFVEAKAFREDARNDDFARDAISKAYNRGVPWAAVTNFSDVVVFDAYEELERGSHPRAALDLTASEYSKARPGLSLLSPDALARQQLDVAAVQSGIRRRHIPIERRLYQSMRGWREGLFNDLVRYLDWRTDDQLAAGDEAIQHLINRLIFLRNCEDRGITSSDLRALRHRLREQGPRFVRVTEELVRIFDRASATFDSEIFETDAVIDVLFRSLVDRSDLDDTLASIIEGLYRVPLSFAEYDFSLMSADVLGQVYEQYLGHVAQRVRRFGSQPALLPDVKSREITVTSKPQRRREQGIYYTPAQIVHHIVDAVLEASFEANGSGSSRSPRILDPACGSGSFLIAAYEKLIARHTERKGKPPTRRERDKILRASIFGVDSDPQAVQIARLNLLIRLVTEQALLPELGENVQLGNSLVDSSKKDLQGYFGDSWDEQHSFSWKRRFSSVFDDGGFDIVVANPPYVGFHGLDEETKAFLRDHYETATSRFDLYIPFVERALQLLKPGGILGIISPFNFMKREHGRALRSLLASRTTILSLHDFEDKKTFDDALNYTGIMVLRNEPPDATHKLSWSVGELGSAASKRDQSALGSAPWVFRSTSNEALASGAPQVPTSTLGGKEGVARGISEGIVTGKNDVFLVDSTTVEQRRLESEVVRPALRGRDVKRYRTSWDGTHVIYPYHEVDGRTVPIAEPDLARRFPNAYEHLRQRKQSLGGRPYFERSSKSWYELWCERSFENLEVDKIVTPEIAPSSQFAMASREFFYLDTACGITLRDGIKESIHYVLAILNSSWANHYYRQTTVPKANGYLIYKTMYLKGFPIRRIDFADPSERDVHASLTQLAKRTLKLTDRLQIAGTSISKREESEQELGDAIRTIDALVFDLYHVAASSRAEIVTQQGH